MLFGAADLSLLEQNCWQKAWICSYTNSQASKIVENPTFSHRNIHLRDIRLKVKVETHILSYTHQQTHELTLCSWRMFTHSTFENLDLTPNCPDFQYKYKCDSFSLTVARARADILKLILFGQHTQISSSTGAQCSDPQRRSMRWTDHYTQKTTLKTNMQKSIGNTRDSWTILNSTLRKYATFNFY